MEITTNASFIEGQIITGLPDNGYRWTNNEALCVVEGPCEEGNQTYVRIIASPDSLQVRHRWQVLATRENFMVVKEPYGWLISHGDCYKAFDIKAYIDAGILANQKAEEEQKRREEMLKEMEDAKRFEAKPIMFDRSDLIVEIRHLLEHGFNGEEFGYPTSDEGVGAIVDEWHKNKASLEEILCHHPNYIPEKHYIAIPKSEFHRTVDTKGIKDFASWCINNIPSPKELKLAPWTYSEIKAIVNHVTRIIGMITNLTTANGDEAPENVVNVNGKGIDAWMEDYAFYRSVLDRYKSQAFIAYDTAYDKDEFARYEAEQEFFEELGGHTRLIRENKGIADEGLASIFNKAAEKAGYDKLGAVKGQKISRIVGKFCKYCGLNTVVKMGATYSGRPKDFGYNYQYATFSDAINPLTFDSTLVISVNPIDYYTMSFGHSWQSCHTIDKWGKRKASHEDDSHNYSGFYSGGTQSYLLDSASIIVYTVDPDWDGGSLMNLEKADKLKRNVFCWGEDKLLQSRLYPDGRNNDEADIEDTSTADEFRAMVQKVFTDCLGVPNYWVLKRGTGVCSRVTESEGTHYRDYLNYEDCNVSFLRKGDEPLNYNEFTIGHVGICPNCGREHNESEYIICEECQDEMNHKDQVRCDHCGSWVDPDDAVYCADNGCYYCDADCAEMEDVHWCQDSEEYHTEDNCYRDDYDLNWYEYENERVDTYDGNVYHNSINARRDGYTLDSHGDWVRIEDAAEEADA